MMELRFDEEIYEVEEYAQELIESIEDLGIKEIGIKSFGSIIGTIKFEEVRTTELEDEIEFLIAGNVIAKMDAEQISIIDNQLIVG